MLISCLREAARRFADTPALIDASGRPTPYPDLDRRSDEVAAGLVRSGVSAGDVVALTLPSVREYVVAYLAAAKVGAVTAGVNPRAAEPERAAMVAMVEPVLVVEAAEQVDGLAREGGRHGGEIPLLPDDPGRPVAVVFTSGTTGTPKGAVFANRQLRAVCATDLGLDTWGGGGPMLASTELAHVGFMTKLAWYLRSGASVVLPGRWTADEALRLVAEHRMAALGGVPPQLALMLRSPAFDATTVSTVERVTLGGGPASPELRRRVMEAFGARLSVRFSCTESGGAGTGTAFDAPEEEALYTEGRPRGAVELSIRDGDGREMPAGAVGAVCLRTPTAMEGYWRDPGATADVVWPDGFVRTGDLGLVDGDGCLRLAGRGKEMYVRGGYNVFPVEVERVLVAHPAVADVAVVPRPDEVMGEVGVAVVVPAEGHAVPTVDDLRVFASPHLAVHKLPEDVVATDALPLTAMHKLDRRALADALAAANPTAPHEAGNVAVLDAGRTNSWSSRRQERAGDALPGDGTTGDVPPAGDHGAGGG